MKNYLVSIKFYTYKLIQTIMKRIIKKGTSVQIATEQNLTFYSKGTINRCNPVKSMEQYKPDFDAIHIASGIMRPTSPTTGRRRRRLRSNSQIPIINALLSSICTSVFVRNILNVADR